MAIKNPIPQRYEEDPCGAAPIIQWQTYAPAGLFLLWTTTPPDSAIKYKTIRGVKVPCGRTYFLREPRCLLETLSSTELFHTFVLPQLEEGTRLYYVISDDCGNFVASYRSPILYYDYKPCPTSADYCKLIRDANLIAAGSDIILPFSGQIAGNPAMNINDRIIRPLAAPPNEQGYGIYAWGRIRRSGIAGTTSYRIHIWNEDTHKSLAHEDFTLNPTESYDWLLNAYAGLTNNDLICIRLQVLSGFNAFQLLGSEHPWYFAVINLRTQFEPPP